MDIGIMKYGRPGPYISFARAPQAIAYDCLTKLSAEKLQILFIKMSTNLRVVGLHLLSTPNIATLDGKQNFSLSVDL